MKMTLVLLCLIALPSCALFDNAIPPQKAYVEADRATFDAIAPVVTALCDTDPTNDPDLTGVNGQALLQTVQTWELRIEAAEEGE
jgi:hypothetical protein